MDPCTRESKFWYALVYGKPQELPEPINATEHYMRLFALKQLGGQTAENTLQIKAAATGEDFLGKKTEDMVSDVEILFDGTTAYLSGTAHYVTGYTQFNETVPEQQEGYFFPFHLEESGCSTMTFRRNGQVTKENITYDPDIVFRFDADTEFSVTTDTGKEIRLDFTGISLEPKAGE